MKEFTRDDLRNMVAEHATLVAIDSDGCVFDTMALKQKEYFHTRMIQFWHLESAEKHVREVAEFLNLYSQWRGQNRFKNLLKTFQILKEMPVIAQAGIKVPDCASLGAYVNSGVPLGDPTLREWIDRCGDPELERVYRWSVAVNTDIRERMGTIPPFKWVRECLEAVSEHSDVIVVSQAPGKNLVKEWSENGIDGFASIIAGQELGAKSEHMEMASSGKYSRDRIIMIGDAPGDLKAAKAVGARFYPIIVGIEEQCWERFHREAYGRFLSGGYDERYQGALISEFERRLPGTIPWIESITPR